MAVADWSTTPASNLTVGGISIAEGCPAGNLNGAVRAVMSDVKAFSLTIPSTASLMPYAGGAFTGDISRNGRGGYLHFASSSLTGGQVFIQPLATALPSSPAEGTIVFQY